MERAAVQSAKTEFLRASLQAIEKACREKPASELRDECLANAREGLERGW